jgi:hypothetical protein
MKAIKVTIKISDVEKWNVDWSNERSIKNELLELNDDIRKVLSQHCGIEYSSLTIDSTLIDY